MESNIIRFTYRRGDTLRFVSHLDLVHVFERAIRRANINVAYSNGFNPRMELVFGNPLPVGLTSDCEMVDIEFEKPEDPEIITQKLNSQLQPVIEVISYECLEKPYENIVKLYKTATYEIDGDCQSVTQFAYKAKEYLAEHGTLDVMKKSKSGEKLTDIKPLIYEIRSEDGKLFVTVACSSQVNLKAELCVQALSDTTGIPFKINDIHKKSAK